MKARANSLLVLLMFAAVTPGARGQDTATVPSANCDSSNVGSANAGPVAVAPKGGVPIMLQSDFDLVRANSYPELRDKIVRTRTFASSADYFRTRFSISRFLFLLPMHYFVEMNPRITNGGPSRESVCAILAHELVHISRMSDGNRIHLLGLVRLASSSYTARFERAADLEAIRRGYGAGLAGYREWVYRNIPAKALKRKQRNYFSPEEIAAILRLAQGDPGLFAYWKAHVPMNLQQIDESATRRSSEAKK